MHRREAFVPRQAAPIRTAVLALCILALLTARRTGAEGPPAPLGPTLAENHGAPTLVLEIRAPAAGFVVHR